jgi:hypothetical protein
MIRAGTDRSKAGAMQVSTRDRGTMRLTKVSRTRTSAPPVASRGHEKWEHRETSLIPGVDNGRIRRRVTLHFACRTIQNQTELNMAWVFAVDKFDRRARKVERQGSSKIQRAGSCVSVICEVDCKGDPTRLWN